MSSQSPHIPKSVHDHIVVARDMRAHMARVSGNLAVSFALSGLVACVTGVMAPRSLTHDTATRAAAAGVALALCVFAQGYLREDCDDLIHKGAVSDARLVLFGYAAVAGFAFVIAFTTWPAISIGRIFLSLAAALAVASLWGFRARRELPSWLVWAEDLIVPTLMLSLIGAGCVVVFLAQDAMDYFKTTVGQVATTPAAKTHDESLLLMLFTIYFNLAMTSYARTMRTGHHVNIYIFFFHPIGGYEPWVPPPNKLRDDTVTLLGASALYARILFPLAIAIVWPFIW